jgi:hypothetical protein
LASNEWIGRIEGKIESGLAWAGLLAIRENLCSKPPPDGFGSSRYYQGQQVLIDKEEKK